MNTSSTPRIPVVRPEAVTPSWLTQALRQRGVDATVESLRAEVVIAGYVGDCRRFFITYKGTPPPDAPPTVFGKFTSGDALAAESGKKMGFYRREVMFYQQLAHRTRIRAPAAYVAEIDADDNCVLILEDLAPATNRDQVEGCTVDEAQQALREAALLHAEFWNDLELMKQPWVSVPEGAQGIYTTPQLESAWVYVKKAFAGRMTPQVIAVCEKFVRNHAWWNRPRQLPKCFQHNDFRPENMMFGGADGRIAVVDWQTSSVLGVGMDVAYFLGGIFNRQMRKAHERPLLKGYHDELLRMGVKDYGFDQLLRDYAHYSMAQLVVAIVGPVIVERSERGDRLFTHMINSAAEQAYDNDALDELPD
ncbi:MAG: phosphotransferase [Nevskia sp.]|nr:phosphotransferase [Nevskia sp.]